MCAVDEDMAEECDATPEIVADDGEERKFVPPPKPVRTEQDWANIAYLEKLRECVDEEKPEGLPLACIVKVIESSDVPMAHDRYALVTVYGPDDRVWRMCMFRGLASVGDDMLFVSDDAALPIDERWVDPMVCPLKERVYKFGFGVNVRRKLPIVRRNIYANNNGVLFPPDDFAKELRGARLGEDCSARLNIESATELKLRQNAKKTKPPEILEEERRAKERRAKPKQKTKASYSFLGGVRWMRKGEVKGKREEVRGKR